MELLKNAKDIFVGRWERHQLDSGNVNFNKLVRSVTFNKKEEKFEVTVR